MGRQELFRWLLKTHLFTAFYGRVIGPASIWMFTPFLKSRILEGLPQGARVLEVGCGPGLQAIEVARLRPDLQLVASDFSHEFVLLAKSNAARAQVERIQFTVADAMDLSSFAEGSFDVVYSLTAIKHFPDPVRGLTECLRVVRPGGRLMVAEILRESTLVEVRALVDFFGVPSALRPLAARVVHGRLCEECPPMETVRTWFEQALHEGHTLVELMALHGLPAWMAIVSKA